MVTLARISSQARNSASARRSCRSLVAGPHAVSGGLPREAALPPRTPGRDRRRGVPPAPRASDELPERASICVIAERRRNDRSGSARRAVMNQTRRRSPATRRAAEGGEIGRARGARADRARPRNTVRPELTPLLETATDRSTAPLPRARSGRCARGAAASPDRPREPAGPPPTNSTSTRVLAVASVTESLATKQTRRVDSRPDYTLMDIRPRLR